MPKSFSIPDRIPNRIGGKNNPPAADGWLDKHDPRDGSLLCRLAASQRADVAAAVDAAAAAQPAWAATPAVARGHLLHQVCNALEARCDDLAAVVHAETGKRLSEAKGEVAGAIQCGRFFAGEGQRLFGRTMPSGTAGKWNLTLRQPCGLAGLIIAANTPIANVAWKVFPALICGNAAVLKAAEDTPATAWLFAAIADGAGLPPGVLNVIQGDGPGAGAALVDEPRIDVLSFTGSTAVGREIAGKLGPRLTKLSLELGGKNAMLVCDDADLENAVEWACLSVYSNAGQRCASCSRLIVTDGIYERFRERMIEATEALRLGSAEDCDVGPVINHGQLESMLAAVEAARAAGARILTGGRRADGPGLTEGYYMEPTLVEEVAPDAPFATVELFGPIAALFRVPDYESGLALVNDSPYGLTSSIQTLSVDRALDFARRVSAGVAVVNGGTYGSEPHMPFGGLRASGNGTREPGTEALDIYSELKDVYLMVGADRL